MGNRNRRAAVVDDICAAWIPPAGLQEPWENFLTLPAAADKQKLLAGVIENEVIPRLLLANNAELAIAPPVTDAMAAKLAEYVGEFSEIVVNRDAATAVAFVETLRQEGASIESIFQDLLAPAARRLGELWDEDINDFLDVTIGIGHMQHIVRAFGSEFGKEISKPAKCRRALLMPLPGEQHTFGISLLREHFLREGWRVWCGPSQTFDDIIELVQNQWFDMVGLSAGAVSEPGALATKIREIRAASVNKDIRIMAGGYAFNTRPELVQEIGADATAGDGRQALLHVSMGISGPKAAS